MAAGEDNELKGADSRPNDAADTMQQKLKTDNVSNLSIPIYFMLSLAGGGGGRGIHSCLASALCFCFTTSGYRNDLQLKTHFCNVVIQYHS